jgi:hypothetical protein
MPFPIIHVRGLNPNGMALFPFILVRTKELKQDKILINHESIHIWQQIELLVLPFYIFYLLNYLFNRIKYKSHYQAYMHIVFEKEAYENESDLDYLRNRRWFSWVTFL